MPLDDQKATEERIGQTVRVGNPCPEQRRECAAVEFVVRVNGQMDCMVAQLGPLKPEKNLA